LLLSHWSSIAHSDSSFCQFSPDKKYLLKTDSSCLLVVGVLTTTDYKDDDDDDDDDW
jgi:hypothetical protein